MKKFILLSCLFLATACAFSQTKSTPIVDETEEKETKTTYVIKTHIENLSNFLLKQYPEEIKRLSITWKKDRHGRYPEYTLTFPVSLKEKIQTTIRKNFK